MGQCKRSTPGRLRADADYYSDMWDMGGFDQWVFGIARSENYNQSNRQWNRGVSPFLLFYTLGVDKSHI